MLAMQDPADGGVYHKLTNLRFDPIVMPDQARERRYVVQKSTAAALDFAAVMAQAARVYAPFDAQFPGLPARMRAAAERAWEWAQAHPDVPYRQPDDVFTGAYGDGKLDDEFAWAAAELFVLTGDERYLQAFERHAAEPVVPSWADVGALAWGTLARHRERLPDEAWRARVADAVAGLARAPLGAGRPRAGAGEWRRRGSAGAAGARGPNRALVRAQVTRSPGGPHRPTPPSRSSTTCSGAIRWACRSSPAMACARRATSTTGRRRPTASTTRCRDCCRADPTRASRTCATARAWRIPRRCPRCRGSTTTAATPARRSRSTGTRRWCTWPRR